MPVPPQTDRRIGRQRLPRSAAGVMSLVELLVVVAIISLLMATATPVYVKIQRRAQATALANDFRVFAAALQSHGHEAGSWPAEAPPGTIPPGVTALEIRAKDWNRISVIGGRFDWERSQMHNGVRYAAVLALTDTADAPLLHDLDMFRMLDESLDDGNLATGNFILGENDCPLLILEK